MKNKLLKENHKDKISISIDKKLKKIFLDSIKDHGLTSSHVISELIKSYVMNYRKQCEYHLKRAVEEAEYWKYQIKINDAKKEMEENIEVL